MNYCEKGKSAPTTNQKHSNGSNGSNEPTKNIIPPKKKKSKLFKLIIAILYIAVFGCLIYIIAKDVRERDAVMEQLAAEHEYELLHDGMATESPVHTTLPDTLPGAVPVQTSDVVYDQPVGDDYTGGATEADGITEEAAEMSSEHEHYQSVDNAFMAETDEYVRYPLSDKERHIIESVVTAEAEMECFAGKMAVAQCILQAAEDDGIRPDEAVIAYKYAKSRPDPTEEAVLAVAAVFDYGWLATSQPIKYFYDPSLCTSSWHESQDYCMTIGCHRFFAENGEKDNTKKIHHIQNEY